MEMSLADLKSLLSPVSINHEVPFEVGKSYIIRTVTMTNLGRVVAIKGQFLILEDACWVADSGRYGLALSTGVLNEVEVYPHGSFVSIPAIVDAQPWIHQLPKESK